MQKKTTLKNTMATVTSIGASGIGSGFESRLDRIRNKDMQISPSYAFSSCVTNDTIRMDALGFRYKINAIGEYWELDDGEDLKGVSLRLFDLVDGNRRIPLYSGSVWYQIDYKGSPVVSGVYAPENALIISEMTHMLTRQACMYASLT